MATKMRVAVIGCGIIGALTAYELSQDDRFQVTVFDRNLPGQGSTGAALGVLMGVISHKKKGRRWHRCWAGLERYETLIPELETSTGLSIPFNQQGLLRLCFDGEDMDGWQRLVEVRAKQDLPLEVLDLATLAKRYPHIRIPAHQTQAQTSRQGQEPELIGAVYSGRDRQVHPQALVRALVQAARTNGVQFHFNTAITDFQCKPAPIATSPETQHCQVITWEQGSLEAEQIIITAGLGSTAITQNLTQDSPSSALDLRPVLGQALLISLPRPLAPGPQPVINGQDIHIAPLPSSTPEKRSEYWIGATVELPDAAGLPPALEQERLDALLNTATQVCPALKEATILRQWSGLRPRPEGRPAPILEPLTGYDNVLLATGHYRNGVLIAPASANWVKAELEARLSNKS